jgi:imidazolonepropionase-like amidohydrolase
LEQEFVAEHRSVYASFREFQDTLCVGTGIALRSALLARLSFLFALSTMEASKIRKLSAISVFERYGAMGGPGPQPNAIVGDRSRTMLPLVRAVTTKALKMGVRIVAGSDNTNNDKKDGLQDELTKLRRAWLSPMATLKAATSVAAECLMIHARTGAIRPGLEADLIVVDRDPTADSKPYATSCSFSTTARLSSIDSLA